MKAMILAAGLGTRLKPLTDNIPKALIEVGKTPLLELVIAKLISAGVKEIIINVFHFAEQIEAFLIRKNYFNIRIALSREREILGTGGGLKNVTDFFENDQPFFLHNVDILSTINLADMYSFHVKKNALSVLAVQTRKSSRYFLVDEKKFICGHEDIPHKRRRLKRTPIGEIQQKAFCGIHVISPAIFEDISENGKFSIIDIYLKLMARGRDIIAYPADGCYWKDVGKLEMLEEINSDLANQSIRIDDLLK